MTLTEPIVQNLAAVVAQADWLASAPPELIARLVDESAHTVLARGDAVYGSGEPADRLFITLSGRIGAWRGTSREAVPSADPELNAGIWYFITDVPLTTLCLENVVTGIPFFAVMRVLSERAEMLTIPAAALTRLLNDHPATGLEVARHIARRLQAFTEQTADLALLDVTRRLAKYLVRLTGPDGTTKAMKQAELASRMGASRQSVNMALSRFVERHWITPVGRGRYRVDDPAALRHLAGDSAPSGAERFD